MSRFRCFFAAPASVNRLESGLVKGSVVRATRDDAAMPTPDCVRVSRLANQPRLSPSIRRASPPCRYTQVPNTVRLVDAFKIRKCGVLELHAAQSDRRLRCGVAARNWDSHLVIAIMWNAVLFALHAELWDSAGFLSGLESELQFGGASWAIVQRRSANVSEERGLSAAKRHSQTEIGRENAARCLLTDREESGLSAIYTNRSPR